MLGTFGFSYVGLIYLLMLFVPNIIWARNKPKDYTAVGENKVLLLFERVGQVFVTCSVLIFDNFNIADKGLWNTWLVLSFTLMILYEVCWIRYFRNPTLKNFYGNFSIILAPLSVLPVLAFLLLGIYGKVIWLIISTIVLGIGHIGIHIQHLKKIKPL